MTAPSIIGAGALLFALVFAAGFALGTLREVVLVHVMARATAILLEIPVMLAIAFLAARFVNTRMGLGAFGEKLGTGLVAFLLLQAGEIAVGTFAYGRPAAEVVGQYGTLGGLAQLAIQSVVIVFPLFAGTRR